MRRRLILLAALAALGAQPAPAQTRDPYAAELPAQDPAIIESFNATNAWLTAQSASSDVAVRRAALYDLGWLWEHGPDTNNQRPSLDWYRKAQEAGSTDAELRLLALRVRGYFGLKADDQTRPRLQALVAQGFKQAAMALGACWQNDACGQPRDLQRAYETFRLASAQGLPWATAAMGILVRDGLPGHTPAQAEALFRQAIAEGAIAGYTLIANMYYTGVGVPVDMPKARALYEQGAKAGEPNAMWSLGDMVRGGVGGPRDYAVAITWLTKSLEAGASGAAGDLGRIYEDGEGVRQDYDKAGMYYRRGIAGGDRVSMNNLGLLYLNGKLHPPVPDSGLHWLELAVARGDSFSACNLGIVYRSGIGVAVDLAKAREWFQKGASSQQPICEEALGEMAESGQAGAANRQEAIQWYNLAAQHGNETAKQALQRLGTR